VGDGVGAKVGLGVGTLVGTGVGLVVGTGVGSFDGTGVGSLVGFGVAVGSGDGAGVGRPLTPPLASSSSLTGSSKFGAKPFPQPATDKSAKIENEMALRFAERKVIIFPPKDARFIHAARTSSSERVYCKRCSTRILELRARTALHLHFKSKSQSETLYFCRADSHCL
jgi:hypothetical protein